MVSIQNPDPALNLLFVWPQDPTMTVEEKIPHMVTWWKEANVQLQTSGLKREMFRDMVKISNLELRDGTNDMFVSLSRAQVPVLLLSAGVGDLVCFSYV